ncbi:hypothetical protein J5N97_005891 [Dioscorea zingiberensis]|uniref:Uncharacterized protein n=1 Tax=Dioscorea zingiberensis TaxID=325984 RepID=A0A9D5DBA8_9LILI|nr:hypothetical protein J5N97_005891 [Dioscorea zingiberensis]
MAGLSHELCLILRRRRSGIAFRIRRRKPLTVRLGGGASGKCPKGGFVSRAVHRMRLRWVSAKWRCAAARLATLYTGLMKDVTEGRPAMEAFHAKLAMESYFAVPSASVLQLVKSH